LKLADLLQQVQTMAKSNLKGQIERQVRIAKPDLSQVQLDQIVANSGSGSAMLLSGRQDAELLEMVEARNTDLIELNESLV
jgi:t-SNARE complex subunit (syntaxin)